VWVAELRPASRVIERSVFGDAGRAATPAEDSGRLSGRREMRSTCAVVISTLLVTIILTTSPHRSTGQGFPKLDIWIRAFIPDAISDEPGYIRTIHGPQGQNWTAIPSPSPLDSDICYLTDQRGFSTDPGVTSRMWSHATLSPTASQTHDTGQTHAVKCKTGADVCVDKAKATGMSFSFDSVINNVLIDINAAASNPCITPNWVAPNIEYKGRFQINLATGDIKFDGSVRKFPAYEAYVILSGKPPVIVFRQDAVGTVLNLAFSRDVHASAKF
jgi:hypothetical protein